MLLESPSSCPEVAHPVLLIFSSSRKLQPPVPAPEGCRELTKKAGQPAVLATLVFQQPSLELAHLSGSSALVCLQGWTPSHRS